MAKLITTISNEEKLTIAEMDKNLIKIIRR